MTDFHTKTYRELQNECKSRNLLAGGKKTVLIERLELYERAQEQQQQQHDIANLLDANIDAVDGLIEWKQRAKMNLCIGGTVAVAPSLIAWKQRAKMNFSIGGAVAAAPEFVARIAIEFLFASKLLSALNRKKSMDAHAKRAFLEFEKAADDIAEERAAAVEEEDPADIAVETELEATVYFKIDAAQQDAQDSDATTLGDDDDSYVDERGQLSQLADDVMEAERSMIRMEAIWSDDEDDSEYY